MNHKFGTNLGHLPARPNDPEEKITQQMSSRVGVGPDVVVAATRVLPTSGNKPCTLLTEKT
jgi:hypothetical protein